MMKHITYLALGTNLGDRMANLKAAILALQPDVQCLAQSPVYETPPWGILDQPAFLNQAIKAETDLEPALLLKHLKIIEKNMGRAPTIRNGPRLIDIDILFYDNLVFTSPELEVPHPRLAGRGFVLAPLADLAPNLQHPVTGQTVRQMLAEADQSGIALYSPVADHGYIEGR
jgi:2-amino-4-hydroxy-6-hydroxymethyldihydropteridine diphosphokinase